MPKANTCFETSSYEAHEEGDDMISPEYRLLGESSRHPHSSVLAKETLSSYAYM